MRQFLDNLFVVCRQNDGGPMFVEFFKYLHQAKGECFIQVPSRLVRHQNLGIHHYGPGNGHPLLFTSGKACAFEVGALFHLYPAEDGVHPPLDLRSGHPPHFQSHANIFPDTLLRKYLEILKYYAKLASEQGQPSLGKLVEVITGDFSNTTLDRLRTMQYLQ